MTDITMVLISILCLFLGLFILSILFGTNEETMEYKQKRLLDLKIKYYEKKLKKR